MELSYINAEPIRYMSCAARIEYKYTKTACVYTDKEVEILRTHVQRDPLYPSWHSIFKELGPKEWVQLENEKVIGYWSVDLEASSRNIVILENFQRINEPWNNSKLTYKLTPREQLIKNRMNEKGLYENISVKGFWD